ncbi:hypothetical protein BD779DRAFT_1100242 [Infundibulicybe gibba]|nr:hypothetical protein BD779DRAFT_1100242 [Infundibulicybe gibba]
MSPTPSAKLGSFPGGNVISKLMCANTNPQTKERLQCPELGSLTCANCQLVRYCSKECQKSHWGKHKVDCKSPYLLPSWRPGWVQQNRAPTFVTHGSKSAQVPFGASAGYLWGNVPAIDFLNLARNEKKAAMDQDFKICFAASGDIRNLVKTVNGLPEGYRGKCEILLNDINDIVVNRNLVALFVLLSPGPSIEEAAEMAIHAIYSCALTSHMETHLRRCIDKIYGDPGRDGFRNTSFNMRGKGKLSIVQNTSGIDLIRTMLNSTYQLTTAINGMHQTMLNSQRTDYVERFLCFLEPQHRLGTVRFRKSGVLAPFSLDLVHFTHPNRLLFSPNGSWMTHDSASPLSGWNVSDIHASGERAGAIPGDLYGCLFFHLKEQFMSFAQRVQDCDIHIVVAGFNAQSICRAITKGSVAPFHKHCFDRIETSNVADYIGIPETLEDWAPLLRKDNKNSALIITSMNWIATQPDELERRPSPSEMKRCARMMGLDKGQTRPAAADLGLYSVLSVRLPKLLGIFRDTEGQFGRYLRNAGQVEQAARKMGLRMRKVHRIHPKRFGLSLLKPNEVVPNPSKEELYDIFLVGGIESTIRFVEFEMIA